MAEGDFMKAHDVFVAQAENDETYAAESLYRAARASLWTGDVEEAKRLMAWAEQTGTTGLTYTGRVGVIRAGIAGLEDRQSEALGLYRQALADLNQAGAVWDVALAGLDMAQFLDPAEPEVASAAAASRETMERLRAAPFIQLLDAALNRDTARKKPAAAKEQAEVSAATS